MWAGSDVCGLLAANVGPFAHNVGLTHGSFAANVGRVEQRLWVSRITFVGRYNYFSQATGKPMRRRRGRACGGQGERDTLRAGGHPVASRPASQAVAVTWVLRSAA